jgi:hypothetical protein
VVRALLTNLRPYTSSAEDDERALADAPTAETGISAQEKTSSTVANVMPTARGSWLTWWCSYLGAGAHDRVDPGVAAPPAPTAVERWETGPCQFFWW